MEKVPLPDKKNAKARFNKTKMESKCLKVSVSATYNLIYTSDISKEHLVKIDNWMHTLIMLERGINR